MALFPQLDEDAIFLSRTDVSEPLSSFSTYSFYLDDAEWRSVEHYFQAMKFEDAIYREKIREALHPKRARSLGRSRLHRVKKDWPKIKVTIMTRALYIQCKTHKELTEALFNTGDRQIIENNNYDYYWGCGRDRRGENHYGKVLMNVRKKLQEEAREAN